MCSPGYRAPPHPREERRLSESGSRHAHGSQFADSELATAAGEDPAAKADSAGRIEILEHAFQRLPPKVGAALVMHRVGGYTVQEIADHLGVARDTVKKYLMRAAEHCRKRGAGRAAAE